MSALNRNCYRLLNTNSETYVEYDDANRLVGWLMGKHTKNFIVQVVKGEKVHQLVVENDNPFAFQKKLLEIMATL